MHRHRRMAAYEGIKNLSEFNPALLGQHDPILRLLRRLCGSRSWLAGILVAIFHVLLTLIPGIAISVSAAQEGVQLLSINDPRELPFYIFAYFVFTPIIWIFYIWQFQGFTRMLALLEQNRVFNKNSIGTTDNTILRSLKEHLPVFNNTRNSVLPLLIAVISGIVWTWSIVNNPKNPFTYGGLMLWFMYREDYLYGVFVPVAMLTIYVVSAIVIRQVLVTIFLYRLFSKNQLKLKPFHPDQCNGLAPVGNYVLTVSLIAVLCGLWVSAVIAFPMLYGQPINLKVDTVLLFAIYIIAVPLILVLSVWGAHQAMAKAKDRVLDTLAFQMQTILDQIDQDDVVHGKDYLKELRERYHIAQDELKTWPFRQFALRGFALTATSPLLSTGISYVVDKFILRRT